MKKVLIWLMAVLMLLAAGCAAPETPEGNPSEIPTTQPTEADPPRFLDENGDGKVNWLALGDSITQGYYSVLENGEGKLKLNAKTGWAALLAQKTGWQLGNSAVGGSGFVHKGTVLDKLSGREHIDKIDFISVELVTLAFGVNDWKGNQKLGSMEDDVEKGGTIYSNMRYIIEKILKDNPDVEIVVISPLNCCRYGNAASNWGMGFSFARNGTLQDVFDAMQEVCDYYKLPMIDLLHNEEINSDIQNWMPDGVHPAQEKHARLSEIIEEELKKILPAE